MRRAAHYLRIVFDDGRNLTSRENLSMASLFGGLALANAKLGAVHGFAGPIGGLLSAPHGAICARLLPLVMKANLFALQTRQPDSPAIPRFAEIASILTGETDARPEDGVAWVEELVADLQIPPLSGYGMQAEHIPSLCDQAQTASSMQGNPIKLTDSELYAILHASLI
jgi:alcohol dehydrogenase class IV